MKGDPYSKNRGQLLNASSPLFRQNSRNSNPKKGPYEATVNFQNSQILPTGDTGETVELSTTGPENVSLISD